MKRRHRAPAVAADAPTPVVVASSGRPACPRRNPSDGPACVASHPPLAARPALAVRGLFLAAAGTSGSARFDSSPLFLLLPIWPPYGPLNRRHVPFFLNLSNCWEGRPQRMEGARCIACIHTCVNLVLAVPSCTMLPYICLQCWLNDGSGYLFLLLYLKRSMTKPSF
jgi:hypothetical protein